MRARQRARGRGAGQFCSCDVNALCVCVGLVSANGVASFAVGATLLHGGAARKRLLEKSKRAKDVVAACRMAELWPMLPDGVCEPSHPAGHTSARRRTEQGQPQPQQRFAEQFATHMRQGTVRCLQRIVARAYRSRPACGGPPAGRRTRTAGRHYHSHMRVCAWWMSAYRRRRLASARALSGAR